MKPLHLPYLGGLGSWWMEESKKMKNLKSKGYWLIAMDASLLNLKVWGVDSAELLPLLPLRLLWELEGFSALGK